MILILFLIIFPHISWSIIYDRYCHNYPSAPQCQAMKNVNTLPKNDACDPITKGDCNMNDLVAEDIASCYLQGSTIIGVQHENLYERCFPEILISINVFTHRIIGTSSGRRLCVPSLYKKKFACGDRGTRCICDTGPPDVNKWDKHQDHKCRCQWFVDYCSIPNICPQVVTKCQSTGSNVRCAGGSINQCVANPNLCEKNNGYCVELEDTGLEWTTSTEKEEGFACIDKNTFMQLKKLSPFCNFNRTDHILFGKGFRRPGNNLDYCCYRQLACIRKNDKYGGYMFKNRPCYCNLEFKKCLMREQNDRKLSTFAEGLLSVVNKVRECSIDDSGNCDPQNPKSCNKGDLIDPAIANCRINCKSGPLLPIEKRSCRIRKCIPPNNLPLVRVIDVPFYKESSRCDAVKEGLPVECGLDHTRCVCDGKPTFTHFSDGCRCQYWPES